MRRSWSCSWWLSWHLKVRFLIEARANLDVEDRWAGTPLVDALRHRHLEVANWLIGCGAKLHEDKTEWKRSSTTLQLCEAAARGNVEVSAMQPVEVLVSCDVRLSRRYVMSPYKNLLTKANLQKHNHQLVLA